MIQVVQRKNQESIQKLFIQQEQQKNYIHKNLVIQQLFFIISQFCLGHSVDKFPEMPNFK
jgi:hypothetical protein